MEVEKLQIGPECKEVKMVEADSPVHQQIHLLHQLYALQGYTLSKRQCQRRKLKLRQLCERLPKHRIELDECMSKHTRIASIAAVDTAFMKLMTQIFHEPQDTHVRECMGAYLITMRGKMRTQGVGSSYCSVQRRIRFRRQHVHDASSHASGICGIVDTIQKLKQQQMYDIKYMRLRLLLREERLPV